MSMCSVSIIYLSSRMLLLFYYYGGILESYIYQRQAKLTWPRYEVHDSHYFY